MTHEYKLLTDEHSIKTPQIFYITVNLSKILATFQMRVFHDRLSLDPDTVNVHSHGRRHTTFAISSVDTYNKLVSEFNSSPIIYTTIPLKYIIVPKSDT
jgi:hypothetical protein